MAQLKLVGGADARERAAVRTLVADIAAACPRRRATSASERRAQEMLGAALEARGFPSELVPFRFNDDLYNGELRWFVEAEIVRHPIPRWLERALFATVAGEPRFEGVRPFEVPVGATDLAPFRAAGYDGVCLGCIDPELETPRHYHLPTDTPEHLDLDEVLLAIDFTERLVHEIIRVRARTAR